MFHLNLFEIDFFSKVEFAFLFYYFFASSSSWSYGLTNSSSDLKHSHIAGHLRLLKLDFVWMTKHHQHFSTSLHHTHSEKRFISKLHFCYFLSKHHFMFFSCTKKERKEKLFSMHIAHSHPTEKLTAILSLWLFHPAFQKLFPHT